MIRHLCSFRLSSYTEITIQHNYNITDNILCALPFIPVPYLFHDREPVSPTSLHFAYPQTPTVCLWTFWTKSCSEVFQRSSGKVRWWAGSPVRTWVAGHLVGWSWKVRKELPFQHVASLRGNLVLWNSFSFCIVVPDDAGYFWNSSSSLMGILPYYTLKGLCLNSSHYIIPPLGTAVS